MKNCKTGNKRALINAAIAASLTILVFSVFAGQFMSSGTVTFAKWSDASRQTYPCFIRISRCIARGESLVGVDTGTWNGATEFYLRTNLPVAYVWFLAFAAIAIYVPPRLMYILFYMCHMFVALFLMLEVCQKHFKMKLRISAVVASLYLYALCLQIWYVSHFIATVLCIVLFYATLEAYSMPSVKNYLQLILYEIMAFTCGYITEGVFLVLIVYLFSMLYTWSGVNGRAIRVTLAFIVGGLIVLPYMLSAYVYSKDVVVVATSMADAARLKLNIKDIPIILSSSFMTIYTSFEGSSLFSLGLISWIVIGFAIADNVYLRLDTRQRRIVVFSLSAYGIILLWILTDATALHAILYALLPVLGGMHLPNRYLLGVLPFVYITVGIFAGNIRWQRFKRPGIVMLCVIGAITAIYIILSNIGVNIPNIDGTKFIVECVLTVVFLIAVCKLDIEPVRFYRLSAVIIWALAIILPGVTIFYESEKVYARADNVKNSSIVYNKEAIKTIDDYIKKTAFHKKDVYRYVAYDSTEAIQRYLMGNYEWYDYSRYNLCNYSGYEHHLCTPKEYRDTILYTTYDWIYLANTRADYLLTDSNTVDSDPALFNKVLDWSEPAVDIGNGRVMFRLKHFVPTPVIVKRFVEDSEDSFDNGYFYSRDLTDKDVVSFDTDKSSYYRIRTRADHKATLLLLPYANRHYHYYVDGVEMTPKVARMQSLIKISPGEHLVEVKYEYAMGRIGYYLGLIAAAGLAVMVLLLKIIQPVQSKKKGKIINEF